MLSPAERPPANPGVRCVAARASVLGFRRWPSRGISHSSGAGIVSELRRPPPARLGVSIRPFARYVSHPSPRPCDPSSSSAPTTSERTSSRSSARSSRTPRNERLGGRRQLPGWHGPNRPHDDGDGAAPAAPRAPWKVGARHRDPRRHALRPRQRLRPDLSRWTPTFRTIPSICRRSSREPRRRRHDRLALRARRRDQDWGLGRRIPSRGSNLVSWILLGFPVHDATGCYRAYRADLLRRIDRASIQSSGYSFVEEVLELCHRAGATMGETPIIFEDRRAGKSKISKKEIVRAVMTLFRLRWQRITGRGSPGRRARAAARWRRSSISGDARLRSRSWRSTRGFCWERRRPRRIRSSPLAPQRRGPPSTSTSTSRPGSPT